jgi:hypothetical protein
VVIAVAIAALGASIAVVGTAGASSIRRTTAPRVVACTTGGLVEWLNTQSNGAAGTIYYELQFTNLSGHVCTLRGYPGVSAITLSGAQLGSAAARSPSTFATVTLGVGKTVTATLGITDVGNPSGSSCKPTTAAGLRIYAPNQTAPKTIPFPFAGCSRAGTNYLFIQPVKK